MKYVFLIFIPPLLALGSAAAQTQRIDSLRGILENTRDWHQQIEIQQSIGTEFHSINIDSSTRYGEMMLRLAERHDYDKGRGMANRMIGETHLYKAQMEQALPYLQKSEDAFRACGDKQNLAIVLANSAFALNHLNRFGESSNKLVATIELARELNDSTGLADAYRNFATLLVKQKRPKEALDYLRKGLAIWLQKGENPHFYYSMMAAAFAVLHQRDSTFFYAGKALAAAEQSGTPRYIAVEHTSLGHHYFKWGDHEQAKAHYLQSLAYFEKTGSNINLPVLYNNLAENENALGNYRTSLEYSQKVLPFVERTQDYITLKALHYNLSRSYAGLGNYSAAFQQSLLWKAASDSLNQIDNARKVAEVESRYRTREQESTIAQQQLQLERQQNRQRIFLLAGLLLLAAAAGLAFFLRFKRQRAELALKLKAAEAQHLEEQDKMKSAFFANISHEFRTPLTLILGPLREMEQGLFKGNATKYYGIMRRSADRLLQLINQLLDLSRLEGGHLKLQPRSGDLRASLRAIAHSFESLATQRQIQYDIALPIESLTALFDREKLEIIIANLLSNAFKFTPEEGKVQLEVAETGNSAVSNHPLQEDMFWLEINVSDTGMGIPAEQQAHVFDRFYQVENTGSDLQPGSGIGLALTKEIVALHGGTISMKSPIDSEGGGAAFTVRLPLQRAVLSTETLRDDQAASDSAFFIPLMERPPESSIQTITPGRTATRGYLPVILIVEDNMDVRNYVIEQLSSQCRILEASNGEMALEIARAELPDLILSDLMMPVMDGTTLTQILKADENTSHIPIVLLTARAGQSDRLKGLETGVEAYLTKPFDADELRLVVAKIIQQREVLRTKFGREIRLGLSKVKTPSIDDLFLQKVLACIEENYDDDMFGVEQLAASVNMSRSNLFRKLDALTGKSPNVIIRELRL
ncbi:MAG: ATP-binding protein, partial [Saprospiraceae bacterium]